MRCLPQWLETVAANQGSSFFSYRTKDPVEWVLSPEYWIPVYRRLTRGDFIRVTIDGDDILVLELAVVDVQPDAIAALEMQRWDFAALAPPSDRLPGLAIKRGFGCFQVVGPEGQVLRDKLRTREDAEAAVNDLAPVEAA